LNIIYQTEYIGNTFLKLNSDSFINVHITFNFNIHRTQVIHKYFINITHIKVYIIVAYRYAFKIYKYQLMCIVIYIVLNNT